MNIDATELPLPLPVILERCGLTAQALARSIVEDVTALDGGEALLDVEQPR